MEWNEMIPDLILIIAGLVICFKGYRLFRLSITLLGAFGGYHLGYYLYNTFGESLGLDNNETAKWVVVLGCTIALGGLAYTVYKKAVIVISAVGFGYWFATRVPEASWMENRVLSPLITKWVIGLVLGLIFGIIVFVIQKWAIMLFTAIAGARVISATAVGILMGFEPVVKVSEKLGETIFPNVSLPNDIFISGVLLILFSGLGFAHQMIRTKA